MKILIVKLSSLGDVVHAMPAVQDLQAALPGAQIDWVVESAFAPLVRQCAGVTKVIECNLRSWRHAPFSAETRSAWQSFRTELDLSAYDRVIDLQGLSKSALVAYMARLAPGGLRVAMAARTDGSSYEPPTRWVAHQVVDLPLHIGALERSRLLCAKAMAYPLPSSLSFGLMPRSAPQLSLAQTAGQASDALPVVALLIGSSRADKQWPIGHWQSLGKRIRADGYALAIAHGNDAEERQAQAIAQGIDQALVWPRLGLDAMVDALAACASAIGVDSGLSHIAAALGLPHVQVYNFDTAWRTGPHGHARQCSVFASPHPSIEQVWQAWTSVRLRQGPI